VNDNIAKHLKETKTKKREVGEKKKSFERLEQNEGKKKGMAYRGGWT